MENNLFNFDQLLENAGISTHEAAKTDILDSYGLNWTVEKEKLYLPNNLDSGFYGIVRQDNKTCFGTCKDQYETFQNSELLELVNEAAGKLGLNVTKAGSFKAGALVYLQLKTGDLTGIGQNNDTVNKYITALNSHDGSCSLKWGIYNRVVSCQNQIWHLKKTLQNSVKHTTNMQARIREIMRSIEDIQEEEKKIYEFYNKFAEAPIYKKTAEDITKLVLDIDVRETAEKDLTTYQKNRFNDLHAAINSETREKGNTLWGIFNGVTKYTTHYMPGKEAQRQQSKAIGKGKNIDNNVFNYLVKEVTEASGTQFAVN